MRRRNRLRGVGKLEFALVLAIFGVLAAALLNRLVAVERDTERLEVDLTIRHIHLGLKLGIGELLMRGEDARIGELLQRNPLDFLEQAKVGAGGTAPGQWRYDAERRILSYRPRQPEAFGGQTELAWRYTASRDDRGRIAGLRLEFLPK